MPPYDDGRRFFRHEQLPGYAQEVGVLSSEHAEALSFLRSMRVRADYHEDGLVATEAEATIEEAKALVEHLLGPDDEGGGT